MSKAARTSKAKERHRRQLKNLSLDDQILVANIILGPATAHDGLVSTLRDHAENVEIR